MKEIKDDTNRLRNIPCSWIGRINIMKMSILYYPKQSIDSMQSLSSYQRYFSQKWDKQLHNLSGNTKTKQNKTQIAKATLRKKNRTGGINLPDSGYTT